MIGALGIEGTGSRIQGDGDVLARNESSSLDGLHDHFAGLIVALQVRREPALVTHAGGESHLLQDALQRMEGLDAIPEGLREGWSPDGHDHEFLEVHTVVGMLPAVQDVHHGHWKARRPRPTQVGVER